ncbi:hypothetical protein F4777DRAFT_532663 [Nemania sp. FL0916]|nr:hypothetical protein F4777DRAFT_532663 [Nemania sp. FL0916]
MNVLPWLEGVGPPVTVAQINRSDPGMPEELITILNTFDSFQSRAGIVPSYLRSSVEKRAKWDDNFYNFRPTTFQNETTDITTALDPGISLDRVLEIFFAANECFDEEHAETTWNTLVHWPIFQLALGAIVDAPKAPPEENGTPEREHQIRVRAMPCTAARLKRRQDDKKMIDFCMFIEPQDEELKMLIELEKRLRLDCGINHTDYDPLIHRLIVLSALSMENVGVFKEEQVQLCVWQRAQWALLESLTEFTNSGGKDAARPMIPFLPALIIQGHDWSFAATTRSGKQTILWLKQDIGKTDSVLGIFQIVHGLRYIARWIRETYWPWYRQIISGVLSQLGEQ